MSFISHFKEGGESNFHSIMIRKLYVCRDSSPQNQKYMFPLTCGSIYPGCFGVSFQALEISVTDMSVFSQNTMKLDSTLCGAQSANK